MSSDTSLSTRSKESKDDNRSDVKSSDKNKASSQPSDRDRDRSKKSSSRSRHKSRDRSSDRDRDRSSERKKDRDRDKGKEKSRRHRSASRSVANEKTSDGRDRRDKGRDRDRRYRSPSRSRSNSPRYRRYRSRSRSPPRRYRSRERSRSRSNDRSRHGSRNHRRRSSSNGSNSACDSDSDKKKVNKSNDKIAKTEEAITDVKLLTLNDIIKQNPGISVPDAIKLLNEHNTAAAMGIKPANMTTVLAPPIIIGGEGGQAMRIHRDLYVGNLPPKITHLQLLEFINNSMKQYGYDDPNYSASAIAAKIGPDGHYAFVEMSTLKGAFAAIAALNGVHLGTNMIKVCRPKGYIASVHPYLGNNQASDIIGTLNTSITPTTNTTVTNAPANSHEAIATTVTAQATSVAHNQCIMVLNLPPTMAASEAQQLLSSLGVLVAFNMIKVGTLSQSAVFEYKDANETTTIATMEAISRLEVAGGRKLVAQRVPQESVSLLLPPESRLMHLQSNKPVPPVSDRKAGRVVRLSNMVTIEDISDDELYNDILEDVKDECSKYGSVQSVEIPRPSSCISHGESTNDSTAACVGDIFVCFDTIDGALKATVALHGRKFNGKPIAAVLFE